MKIRVPFDREWDNLVDLTGGDNAKIHWERMFSWVNDPENKRNLPPAYRAYCGYFSARIWSLDSASHRSVCLGFRPACIPASDTLISEIKEGENAIIGTLFMDGRPVKVPQNPTLNGDIEDYIHGAKLEMREALPAPAYQVTGIRVGDAFIADRCLLKYISYEEVESALC